jgi:hypothetical protein
MVGVDLHNLHIVIGGVLPDDIQLIFGRILLVFGRHPNILSRTGAGRGIVQDQKNASPLHRYEAER